MCKHALSPTGPPGISAPGTCPERRGKASRRVHNARPSAARTNARTTPLGKADGVTQARRRAISRKRMKRARNANATELRGRGFPAHAPRSKRSAKIGTRPKSGAFGSSTTGLDNRADNQSSLPGLPLSGSHQVERERTTALAGKVIVFRIYLRPFTSARGKSWHRIARPIVVMNDHNHSWNTIALLPVVELGTDSMQTPRLRAQSVIFVIPNSKHRP